MPSHHVKRFHKRFFTHLGRALGDVKVEDWSDLGAIPVAILIDEFGHFTKEVARLFVPSLHRLAQENPNTVRVVVCLPVHMAKLLRDEFHFSNSKHWEDWYHIEVGLLDENGVDTLLGLLPKNARAVALARRDNIIRVCSGRPKRLQALCHDLFSASQQGATEPALRAIIDDWQIDRD